MDDWQASPAMGNGLAAQGGIPAGKPGGSYLHYKVAALLRKIWLRRRLFAGIVAVGILCSLLWAFTRPIVYTSSTTLMPPDSSASSAMGGIMASSMPVPASLFGVRTPSALFLAILGSRSIEDSLVADYDLVRRFKVGSESAAALQLGRDTKLKDDAKSGTVTISVTARDPRLAAQLAGGYVEELNGFVTRNSTSAAHRERVFLEQRIKELKQDLDNSAKALSQFSSKNKTIDIPSQSAATMTYEIRLRSDLQTARSELASLQQIYADDNVRVRSVKARIAQLENQLARTIGAPQDSGSDLSSTDVPSVTELPSLTATYADLLRSVKAKETLWDLLNREYESARVQEAKDIPTVRVLDPALVPNVRSAPARTTIVLFGTFVSALFALALVLAVSAWDEMDPRTDPKKLVFEIIDTTVTDHAWLARIPVLGWAIRRIRG